MPTLSSSMFALTFAGRVRLLLWQMITETLQPGSKLRIRLLIVVHGVWRRPIGYAAAAISWRALGKTATRCRQCFGVISEPVLHKRTVGGVTELLSLGANGFLDAKVQ